MYTKEELQAWAKKELDNYGVRHLLVLLDAGRKVENYEQCQAITDVLLKEKLPSSVEESERHPL